MDAADYPEPPFTRVRLNFIHFETQSRSQDIWLLFMMVMATLVVCPRLFVILTTLTFGALRRNHIVSTAFETIAKKKKTGFVVHVRSAMYREVSRTQPKLGGNVVWNENQISRPWRFHKKRYLLSYINYPCRGFISITVLISYKKIFRIRILLLRFEVNRKIFTTSHL